jgi:hypothetical protein
MEVHRNRLGDEHHSIQQPADVCDRQARGNKVLLPGHHCLLLEGKWYREEQRNPQLQPGQENPPRDTCIAADSGDHDVGVENRSHMTNIWYCPRYCERRISVAAS